MFVQKALFPHAVGLEHASALIILMMKKESLKRIKKEKRKETY